MADISQYAEKVEEALKMVGVDPTLCRSSETGQWNLKRNDVEIWVDIWDAEEHDKIYFQAMAPLVFIPKEGREAFYRELLDLNYQTIEAWFVTYNEGVYIKTIREIDLMGTEAIFLSITRVAYYAEMFEKAFLERHPTTKLIHHE